MHVGRLQQTNWYTTEAYHSLTAVIRRVARWDCPSYRHIPQHIHHGRCRPIRDKAWHCNENTCGDEDGAVTCAQNDAGYYHRSCTQHNTTQCIMHAYKHWLNSVSCTRKRDVRLDPMISLLLTPQTHQHACTQMEDILRDAIVPSRSHPCRGKSSHSE